MDDRHWRTGLVNHRISAKRDPEPHRPVGKVRSHMPDKGVPTKHLENTVKSLDKVERGGRVLRVDPIGNLVNIRSSVPS